MSALAQFVSAWRHGHGPDGRANLPGALNCFSHLLAACLEGGQQLAGEGYGEIIGQVAVFLAYRGDIEAYAFCELPRGIRPANIRQPFAAGAARSGHAPFDKAAHRPQGRLYRIR